MSGRTCRLALAAAVSSAPLSVLASEVPSGRDVAAKEAIFDWNFDVSNQSFGTDEHPWKRWYYSTIVGSDPLGTGLVDAQGADAVWSTNLPSNPETYATNLVIHLYSPVIDLPVGDIGVLALAHHFSTQSGGDGGRVAFRTELNSALYPLVPFGGYPGYIAMDGVPTGAYTGAGDWGLDYFDLSEIQASSTEAVRGRFELEFRSNNTGGGQGWHIERMLVYRGDVIPPVVTLVEAPSDTDRFDRGYPVVISVLENQLVTGGTLSWETEGRAGSSDGEMALTLQADGTWTGSLPSQDPDTQVRWRVDVGDGAGNVGMSPDTLGAFHTFEVALQPPGPPELADDPGRLADTVKLRWAAPATTHRVALYRVYRASSEGDLLVAAGQGAAEYVDLLDGETAAIDPAADRQLVLELTSDEAEVEATLDLAVGSGEWFGVTALYTAMPDDPVDVWESPSAPPLRVEAELPALDHLDPAEGYQGQSLDVDLYGENTDFVQGRVAVDVGSGVGVDRLEVVDARHVRISLRIDPTAVVGERSLSVAVGGESRGSLPFQVVDDAARPAIVGVSPRVVSQGDNVTVKFQGTNTDFKADPPAVDFGAGILQAGEVTVAPDGASFTVSIFVEPSCPVGVRSVLISNRSLVFSNLPFEVRAGSASLGQGCQTVEGPAGGLLWGLFLGLALRRRRVSR